MAKFATLVEDFNSTSAMWTYGTQSTVTGGLLSLVVRGDYGAYGMTASSWDLTDSSLFWTMTGSSGADTYGLLFTGSDPNGNAVGWTIGPTGTLQAIRRVAGVDTVIFSVANNAVTHKYVRIRANGNVVSWDTSTDTVTWTQRGSTWTATYPLTALKMSLGTGGSSATPSTFDKVNVVTSLDPYGDLVLSDVPTAWYRLNGSTADAVAGGSSGVLTNGATYGTGILTSRPIAQVASFDGVNDYIQVPDQARLDVATNWTVEAWCIPVVSNVSQVVFTKNNWGIELTSAGSWQMFYNSLNTVITAGVATAGALHHVAIVGDGATARLYVNGTQVGTNPQPSAQPNTTDPFRIGMWENTSFFNGRIAEVAVYNRALSAGEIQEHFVTGVGPAPVLDPYGSVVLNDAPIAWYRGNGSTFDTIGGGTPGVLTNGATYGAGIVPSGLAQSFNFDGTNDYVDIPDQAKLDPGTSYSIEAWVCPDIVDGNYHSIAAKNGYGLQTNGARFEFYGVAFCGSPTNFVANTVYHIVGTADSTTMLLYINGVQVTSTPQTGSVSADTNPFQIGAWQGLEFFDGRIAEVAVYNRVLTAAEVQEHYQVGTAAPATPTTVVDRWDGTNLIRQQMHVWLGP